MAVRTNSENSLLGQKLLPVADDAAKDPGASLHGRTPSLAAKEEEAFFADPDPLKFGGIRVSRFSRSPAYFKKLSAQASVKLRVWRVLNGPLELDDRVGRALHATFQVAVVSFIVLVIAQTERTTYTANKVFFHYVGSFLAGVLTLEYFLSLWSVVANEEFARGSPFKNRLKWATKFYPAVDLIVIVSFWVGELLSNDRSNSTKIAKALQTLRLIRLIRIFEVFEERRVKRAFTILFRVVRDKGEDIFAALLLMFISLIFIATCVLYLVFVLQFHSCLCVCDGPRAFPFLA